MVLNLVEKDNSFSFGDGYARNYIIFVANLINSSHADNRTNNILVLGKNFTQEINGTTIYAEKLYSINFTEINKKILFELAL